MGERDAESQEQDQKEQVARLQPPDAMPVVALGGAEGSLDSLGVLLSRVPRHSGLAYVAVLDIEADEESRTHERLKRSTELPVILLSQGAERLRVDHVYVAPASRSLRSLDGHLHLGDAYADTGGVLMIDHFFRTLADTHGPHAAGVVLGGWESDGMVGIKRIKERGGLTVAQDPGETEQSAASRAAIATGMIDWVLPVEDIALRVSEYFERERTVRLPPEKEPRASEARATGGAQGGNDEAALRDVLTFLRTRTGRDFVCYKRATILRRIGRRMQVNGVDNLHDYLVCLRTRPGEAGALLQDLLISVTNFFRDAECFNALERQVPLLFANKGANDTVRVWVAACATGEEAYSIAMMLSEHARSLDAPPLIQIFATDLDEDAIQAARDGIYPSAIEADVSEERLRRFFVKEHTGYRVRRELREMVLFATHDVLKDSPFSRLDLISCRNLLIYLNIEAQSRVFDIFHFALLPTGRLFLGSSESVEDGSQLFSVLDKKHRLYGYRPTPRVGLPVPSGPGTLALALEAQQSPRSGPVIAGSAFAGSNIAASRGARPVESRQSSWGEVHLRLLEQLAPPSILVDSEYEVVHLSTSAGRFLQFSGGEPSRNLLRAVNPSLRIELRAALYQAGQSKAPADVPPVPVELNGEQVLVSMRITPVTEIGADMFLVVIQAQLPEGEGGDGPAIRAEADPVARQLDRELERLKSHLRDTVEQYEASTEELKASNEELQAMNEELRSATEELETSREELQSINEELTTVNHELKSKVDELGHANSDMHNLMDATAIATVFLDRELRITRYTPSAVTLFNLIPTDVGRPLTDLTTQLHYPEMGGDAQRVLERLVPIEREVGQADGSWYLARLLPYRTIEDRIAGVVLSFVNITERKQAEEVRLWLSAVVTASSDAIISFSLDHSILSWNGGAARVFGYSAEEAIGQPLSMLDDAGGEERELFTSRLVASRPIENFETTRRRKDGSVVDVSVTESPILDESGKVIAGTAIIRDISGTRRIEEALRDSREQLRMILENASEFAIFSTDLERRVATWNTGAQALLGYGEDEVLGRPADVIFTEEDRAAGVPEREAETALAQGRASDDRFHQRKDGSRFWASGAMMLMRDAQGQARGFVKILRDQSATRQAQQALQNSQLELTCALQEARVASDALEAADVAKDRFLAVLSHELRNPLASIAAASQVLEVKPGTVSGEAAEVIRRQSSAISALLDDMLDISKLRLGRLSFRRRPTGLVGIIEGALQSTRPVIEAAGHTMEVRLPARDIEIDVDPNRFVQVVSNLLVNAAKYTPNGGRITLEAELRGAEVVVEVSDNGIGMKPEEIDRLFDMFSQAPDALERSAGGMGIGLALSRNILEMHGGWIRAESDGPGKGSRISFGVPALREMDGSHAAATPVAGNGADIASGALVLLADDNQDAAWAVGHWLALQGFSTLRASDGPTALALAETHRPSVMLVDIGMPGLTGHEVARQVRARSWGPEVLMIAVTGWGQEHDVKASKDAGFDLHLSKPVDMARLREAIEEHLRGSEGAPAQG